MAVHLQRGEVVVDPGMRGKAELRGFCGGSTSTCKTTIVRKKSTLNPAVARRKQDNMPRESPIPRCNPVGFKHQSSLGTVPSHGATKHP